MKVDEGSYVSLGIVITIVGGFIGFAVWMARIDSMARNNHEMLKELREKRFTVDVRIYDQLEGIKERLGQIEGYMEAQKDKKRLRR